MWLRLGIFFFLLVFLVACGDAEESITLKANAGEDFAVTVGEAPEFDACASEGEIENYQWTILNAPTAQDEDEGKFIRETESNCKFTLEDTMVIEEVGEWIIQLQVRSADGKTATDTVTITVNE